MKKRKFTKKFKRLLFIILIAIIIVFIAKTKLTENEKEIDTIDVEVIADQTVNIAVIGDIMCHNTQFQDAYNKADDTYDFSYVFEDVKDYLTGADLTIGNLETTFAGKERGYSGYPTFNTPEVLGQNLKDLGVDVLSTVNNHCMDKGIKGLESTIDKLDELGIAHTGTFKTEEDSQKVLVVETNGVKFGIIAYTYGTNGIPVPQDNEFSVNLIDKDKIKADLDNVKKENVDVIIAMMHWGIEYQTEPNSEQKDLADFLFENGVDIVLGGHPHVLQTMEKRDIELADGSHKDGFIVYSLGNFVSGQVKANTKQSVILNIGITKHNSESDREITIDDVSYVPIYMNDTKGTPRYSLLDIRKWMNIYDEKGPANSMISSTLYKTLMSEIEHIYWIMGDEIHKDF